MIDFPIFQSDSPTWAMWTICGLMYFFTLCYFYKSAIYDTDYSYTTKGKKWSFVFLVFVFSLCAFYTGDWMHLQTMVKNTVGNHYIAGMGLERIYTVIIDFVNGNYLYFRVIVWGIGIICLLHSFKLSGIDPHRALFFLFSIYITSFVYARVGVALSIYFLGFTLLFLGIETKKTLSIVIGAAIVFSSMFCHRSLLVLVVLTPFALFPIKKKTIPLLVIGVIGVYLMQDSLIGYALDDIASNEEYTHRLELYELTYKSRSLGINLYSFFWIWRKLVVHIPLLVCLVKLYKKINLSVVPFKIQAVFRFSILLYALALIFLGAYGMGSPYFYRYEGMLYIPITIMAMYLYQEGDFSSKSFKILYWFCTISQVNMFLSGMTP